MSKYPDHCNACEHDQNRFLLRCKCCCKGFNSRFHASPANAAMSRVQKLERWKIVNETLESGQK